MFIFEIPDERVEVDGEDKPRWLSSRRFTVRCTSAAHSTRC